MKTQLLPVTPCLVVVLQTVLQMPAAVRDLAVSHDEQLLFVACWSGVYCVKVQLLVPRYKSLPVTQ